MRTLQSFLTFGFVCAALSASLAACSSDSDSSTGAAGAAGTPTGEVPGAGAGGAATSAGGAGPATGGGGGMMAASEVPGDATNGATLYASSSLICNSCHGANAEGGIGPNITASVTAGIGSWTQAQFFNAVRNKKSRSGKDLCSFMVAFPVSSVSDQGIYDIYAFVKSKTNDTVNKGSGMCDTE